MVSAESLLLVRLSSLGDILLCMPAAKALKKHGGASISWLVEHPVKDFLLYQDFVDDVIVFPRREIEEHFRKGKFLKAILIFLNFLNQLRSSRYDILLDLHGSLKSALLSYFVRSTRRIGLGKPFSKEFSHIFYDEKINGKKRLHKVERNMLFLSHLGMDNAAPEIKLLIPPEKEEKIEDLLKGLKAPLVIVNPFSSLKGRLKRWGMEKYEELIRRIRRELNAEVLILFGEKEREEAQIIFERVGRDVILPPFLDLFELCALFKRAKLYVGGDSGIMHLASFFQIPIVAIFGPTDHLINGPYSKSAVIVRKDIPCSPCKNKGCKKRACLEEITVEDVFLRVKKSFEESL